MAQARITWVEKKQFVGTGSTNHSLVISTQDEENATGLSPSELLLLALGGCTSVNVISILHKKRQVVTGLDVHITGQQDADPPWTFRQIHLEYVIRGREISEQAVQRAIQLSEEKYCSVGATISGVAQLTSSYRLVEDDQEVV
jgi:putative redox protein